jgi:hypothetical protein
VAYQDASDIRALAQEHLNKAINFQQMGMAASAEHELAQARQLDPAIVSDVRYQSLGVQKAKERSRAEALKLPMRVAAILLLVDAGITALLWLLNLSHAAGRINVEYLIWGLAHVGINVFVAINLLKQKETAPRLTMWWAVLGLIAGGLVAIAWGQVLSLILQITYSGALLLLVMGKPSTRRVAFAVVVFVTGYLGGLCGVFARAVVR